MNPEIILPKAIAIRESLEKGIIDMNALKLLLYVIENSVRTVDFDSSQMAHMELETKIARSMRKRIKNKKR